MMLALTAVVSMTAAEPSADRLLRDCADKIARARSVDIAFTINGGDGPIQGSATLQGSLFVFTTPVINIWFDGTTQWTLQTSVAEVNITEPTAEELMESNPFAILSNYSAAYNVRRLPDQGGHKRVVLTPSGSGSTDVERAIIHIGSDGWPTAAEIQFDGGRTISATVDAVSTGASHPLSSFRFDPARHPGVTVIDLR